MKETRNVSLASQSFIFEEDAYQTIKSYLDDISARLPDEDRETMEDIEFRLAEIFQEKLPSPMMVLTQHQVKEAMEQLGAPSDFGEPYNSPTNSSEGNGEPQSRPLRRPLENRSIAGVCSGLALFLGIDITMMRLLTLFLILFGGVSIWIYIILWIVIPEERLSKTTK